MEKRTEILVSGFGGQGVVRVGQILSTAAVSSGLHTTMLVSHGTETRGGYVRSQVVISDEEIDSPVVENPDFLCALSKAAYNRFKHLVSKGTIIYDPAFIEPDETLDVRQVPFPARDIAVEKLGREIFANVIVVGYLAGLLSGTLTKEAVAAAVRERIPKFQSENAAAFAVGYSLAETLGGAPTVATR
ncbi:MAG: 2-oxoacid:acceptor oxidoreductase family protein [Chloroflexi bacterium]|nr:2-oxoacid:acceptor oxidoreductase family protein [Chloroflexota bacterium]MCL5108005.1 2-oxoacid:acceptor oxidoreductase family protein [Chloroflexota bacterium]